MAPLHDNHSDVYLIAGCGVGGIKAAGYVTGLEMGTGEPVSRSKVLYQTVTSGMDERTVESLYGKSILLAGADASVVELISFESWK